MTFIISENNKKKIKRKFIILVPIFTIIICFLMHLFFTVFYPNDNYSPFNAAEYFIVVIIVVTGIMIIAGLKAIDKNNKKIKYVFENDRLIIWHNNYEQYDLAKEDIKCFYKYKNKIKIFLNDNRTIVVNKYLDNYNEIIIELSKLAEFKDIKNFKVIKRKLSVLEIILTMLMYIVGIGIIVGIIIGIIILFRKIIGLF